MKVEGQFRPSGVHCVLYAFFGRDENLDRARMRDQIEAVVGVGVDDITVLVVFIMQSLEDLVLYGKRLFARHAGLGEIFDRAPSLHPTDFGLATVDRMARRLAPFGTKEGQP